MTKISQLSDIGGSLAAGDEFVIRDISDISTPNKKVTASGFIDYVIAQGVGSGFTQIAAGVGPLSRASASSSGATGTLTFSTAAATTLIERARIDSSGRLLVGTSTSRAVTAGISGNWEPRLQVTKTGTDAANIAAYSFSTYAVDLGGGLGIGPDIVLARSNSGTEGTQAAIANNMLLGRITFNGSDGTAFQSGAFIAAASDGQTWASDDCPARLVFSTAADGGASPTERMRIDSAGRVLVGTSTANTSGAKLQTSDGLTFPAAAVASADPNTLDDYEEGTFTPAILTGGGGPVTLSTAVGQYTKTGNIVNFRLRVTVSNANSASDFTQITGLPFTVSSTISSRIRVVAGDVSNVTGSTEDSIGKTYINASTIRIFTSIGGNIVLTNSSTMDFNGTYFV